MIGYRLSHLTQWNIANQGTDLLFAVLALEHIAINYVTCSHFVSYKLHFHFMISTNTYGSHKNRPFKDESHKGSAETMDGEEKKDASKEDLDQEGG